MSIAQLLVPNKAYLKPFLAGLPSALSDDIADEWNARLVKPATVSSWLRSAPANSWLKFTTEAIRSIGVPRSLYLDEADIDAKAKALSRHTSWLRRSGASLADVQALAGLYHLHLPDWTKKPHTTDSVWARACDLAFWKRQIRAVHSRLAERGAIIAGRVHNRAGLYASDDQVKRTIQRKRRSAQVLANQLVINELGQEYSLADLAALSPANPLIRRAELMVRLRGFETIAKQQGHACDFFTVTCPGSYHPRLSKTGQLNPNYQPGIGPREAQAHLQKVWSRARAKLHRKGIRMYGFRVAEPHHDGTPHWHMVLFFNEADRRDIRKVLRSYALQVNPSERGAWRRRCTFKKIDLLNGSACGYVAKYICKNVDGRKADSLALGEFDHESNPNNPALLHETAIRVESWAKWGIRQFQQIGCAPVTVWRELRRLDATEQRSELADIITATQASDWAGYVMLQGGPFASRKELAAALYSEPVTNRYGEESATAKGVDAFGVIAISRIHTWTISHPLFGAAAHGHRTEEDGHGGASRPWTRITNCTHQQQSVSRISHREALLDEIDSSDPFESSLITHWPPPWMQ
ncbi:replication endonuclease [Aquitalea aquatica]|uniref:Replication endonuclease n=1 Tax=Aquitalea aquatica TaxID=3044273 RepID=A0A838YAQ5_9NEIS|nr:replication endonuclease [Aquitalea magnusonii]MBA4710472.1 replication endonuclease [Aquitalea magnusonii]